jgi:GNAT superfamily N-acetyltransferase
MSAVIRPYRAADREAVRQLCADTAERGAPTTFPDRELVADLVTNYYLDQEPEHCWVAEDEDQVVGYLTGCLDSRRWRRALWRIVPAALWRALWRGTFCRQFHLQPRSVAGTEVYREFPAHLHLNVATGYRGQGLGRQLLARFERQVRDAGIIGIHANVRADNEAGRNSFARLGFSPMVPRKVVRGTVVYGKKI